MSIEQGDRIGWICPVCKKMCHSYDIVCPFCATELENRERDFFKILKMFEEEKEKRGRRE